MLRIGLLSAVFLLLLLIVNAASAHAGVQQVMPTPSSTSNAPANAATPSPTEPGPLIISPVSGQAVQGTLSIDGSSSAPGFASAELDFAYAGDATDTWFLIAESDEPVQNGVLVQWDTGAITDGDYDLRLRVFLEDGSHLDAIVHGLRVRNYTPIETDTPTPVTPTLTQIPGETPVPTVTLTQVLPTPTPLPPNPAEVSNRDILQSLGRGALVVLGVFALLAVYVLVKGIVGRG